MTIGPAISGVAATSPITAQPPWQLPIDARLGRGGMRARRSHAGTKPRPWHVAQGLPGLGLGKEDDEVDGVAGAQGDADLRIILEAADAGALSGTRVDDHIGALALPHGYAVRRADADERVIDRPAQLAPVHDHLVIEDQDGRAARSDMRDIAVATLAQHIPEEDRALPEIDAVTGEIARLRQARLRSLMGLEIHQPLADPRETSRLERRQAAEAAGEYGRFQRRHIRTVTTWLDSLLLPSFGYLPSVRSIGRQVASLRKVDPPNP